MFLFSPCGRERELDRSENGTKFTAVTVSPAQPKRWSALSGLRDDDDSHLSPGQKEEAGLLARKVDGAKFPNPRLRAMR